jgi:hypothetical protein
MSDEQNPDIEELKQQVKIEVEEELNKVEAKDWDVAAELQDLGRQFADTVRKAWNSQERQRIEQEVREGVKSFADEVDKAIREAKDMPVVSRAREEAEQVATKVESTEVARKARVGLVQGLQWLSEELGKLADQFTPTDGDTASSESTEE